jgi:protein ImuB
MRIPSYDDLTPSIPDVLPGEVFTSVAAVLPKQERREDDAAAVSSNRPEAGLRVGVGPHARSRGWGPATSKECGSSLSDNPTRGNSSPDAGELYAALHDPAEGATDRLTAIARDFSPRIERHRGGTVVLDVSGLQRLFGDPRSIADHLARAGAPHVAIAVSQTAAILLARACAGVTVAAGAPGAALHDVSLTMLQQLCEEIDGEPGAPADRPRPARGAGASRRPHTFDVLRRWGLTTVGGFAALPAAELSARLGAAGISHQRLARGLDPRPLVPDPGVRRFIESFELEWPIDTLEPLSFVFARLLDPLAAALEQADRGGVALHLRLRLTDRTAHVRTLGLPAPMRDPRVLRTLLLLDLESHPPPAAVDVVTIEIDPAPGRVVQYSLLERPVPSPETMATLMARLGALVGETRCGSPQILDTHRPDGWVMVPVAFDDRGRRSPEESRVASGFSREAAAVAQLSSGRPSFRLKAEATQIGEGGSHATAPGDHAPGLDVSERSVHASRTPGLSELESQATRTALRRFRPPVAVRVAVEGGRPVRVAIDRRGMPGGAVRQAAGPWRTSGGWWHTEHWNRDEWDVSLDEGTVCRLFQCRDSEGWFVEGIYD